MSDSGHIFKADLIGFATGVGVGKAYGRQRGVAVWGPSARKESCP